MKFNKKLSQNFLIYNLKNKNDICSGLQNFHLILSDIDYSKNKFNVNKNYLFLNKNYYCNFFLTYYKKKNIFNSNLPFKIINFIIIFIFKYINIFYKLIILKNYCFIIKKYGIIIKKKKIKNFFFFPLPNIFIYKIFYKKNLYIKKKKKKIIINFLKYKSEKINFYLYKIIKIINKNVFYKKI